jgi:hypothetical protein
MKKYIFLALVAVLSLGVLVGCATKEEAPVAEIIEISNNDTTNAKEVVLNADSDMPVTKFLHKVDAGTYQVTTNFDKVVPVAIVKDEINVIENSDYPDELNFVEIFKLTGNPEKFEGSVGNKIITIAEDESISLADSPATIFLEKQE